MDNVMMAELTEWQTRAAELQNAVERLTEQRDAARASVDLLMHDNHDLQVQVNAMTDHYHKALATIERLRIYMQQGAEL